MVILASCSLMTFVVTKSSIEKYGRLETFEHHPLVVTSLKCPPGQLTEASNNFKLLVTPFAPSLREFFQRLPVVLFDPLRS